MQNLASSVPHAVRKCESGATRREYGVQKVADVPTGVDVEFFRPVPGAVPEHDILVFTGCVHRFWRLCLVRCFEDEL